jgi:Derlin-2/3
MDQFVAELRKIPPVTRFLTASSLAVTLPVLLNVVSPYKVLFVKELVFKKLEVSSANRHGNLRRTDCVAQLWRLYTSFFLGREPTQFSDRYH